MEGEHAQMWQIPCKTTNSSSKPLQTLGKWYQPRNPKKIPNLLKKKILKLFHTQYLDMAVLSLEWSRIRIQPSRQDEFLWGMKFLSFDRMMLSLSTGCYAKLVSCKCQMLGAAASLQQKKWKRGFFLCKFSCWMSQNPSQHFATRKVHGS